MRRNSNDNSRLQTGRNDRAAMDIAPERERCRAERIPGERGRDNLLVGRVRHRGRACDAARERVQCLSQRWRRGARGVFFRRRSPEGGCLEANDRRRRRPMPRERVQQREQLERAAADEERYGAEERARDLRRKHAEHIRRDGHAARRRERRVLVRR